MEERVKQFLRKTSNNFYQKKKKHRSVILYDLQNKAMDNLGMAKIRSSGTFGKFSKKNPGKLGRDFLKEYVESRSIHEECHAEVYYFIDVFLKN